MLPDMKQSSTVALASDHAGFTLKEAVKKHLEKKGIRVIDVGTFSEESVDYPAIIRKGCEAVLKEGIPGFVFGGSGNGEAMAANKVRGIRAAVCWSEESARLARAHNDANIMSLGGRLVDHALALNMVDIFLSTPFEGGRHLRRIQDLDTSSGS
jgi:ribose 5-phosphate isomerase B